VCISFPQVSLIISESAPSISGNPSGLMATTQTWKYYKDFETSRIIVNAPWYVTNDALHHNLDVSHVLKTTLKDSARNIPIG